MRGSFHICRGGIDSLNMVLHTLESWYWRILGSTPFHPLILGWAHSRAVTSANETILLKLVFHFWRNQIGTCSCLTNSNMTPAVYIYNMIFQQLVGLDIYYRYLPAAIRSDTSNQIGSDVDRPHMAHTTGGHFCFVTMCSGWPQRKCYIVEAQRALFCPPCALLGRPFPGLGANRDVTTLMLSTQTHNSSKADNVARNSSTKYKFHWIQRVYWDL